MARGMPNGIANPIQETSGTNGGSMFYRYCSRRSVDVRLESAIRILCVLSAVCKRIYGLAFVYRRPCYDFPRRQLAIFLPGRSADVEKGIKMGDPRQSGEGSIYAMHVMSRFLFMSSIFLVFFNRLKYIQRYARKMSVKTLFLKLLQVRILSISTNN